jgi:hypothetical protein
MIMTIFSVLVPKFKLWHDWEMFYLKILNSTEH